METEMKTELKIFVHHSQEISKRWIKSYLRDAVDGWKYGYHPEDHRRSIKKVTFKKAHNEKTK
jgi:hypothetical protein